MESIGQRLQRERENQGKSLEEISAQTRISIAYLKAIESNDTAGIPGKFFFRSFVRQYAKALDLPETFGQDQLEYLAKEQEAAERERVTAVPERVYSVPPIPTAGVNPRDETRKWVFGVALLTAVLVICSLAYAFWERYRSTVANQPQQQPPPIEQPKPVEQSKPIEPAPSKPEESKPAETAPAEVLPPAPAPRPIPAVDGVRLSVTAKSDVWTEIDADGERVYFGVLKEGETRDFAAKESVRLKVGNAGSITLLHQGKEIAPIGTRGQVRTVEFTKDGVADVPVGAPRRGSKPPQA